MQRAAGGQHATKGMEGEGKEQQQVGTEAGTRALWKKIFLQENTADMMDIDCVERKSFVTVMVWWVGEHNY